MYTDLFKLVFLSFTRIFPSDIVKPLLSFFTEVRRCNRKSRKTTSF